MTLITAEAGAHSPWSPEEESPAGNSDAGFCSLTRGRVTNLPK